MNKENSVRLIKAVIFDCDGTLIDSEMNHYLAWKEVLARRDVPFSMNEYYSLIGRSGESIAKLFSKQLNNSNFHDLFNEKREAYLKTSQENLSPIHGTVNFLKELAGIKNKLGLKLAVASAATTLELSKNIAYLGVKDMLDEIISGHDDLKGYSDPEGVNKPKPYIYLHTAKLLNVLPEECIVIEDSQSGVAAAVHAGCFTIAAPNPYTKSHDLSLAHKRIESFRDVNVNQFLDLKFEKDN